MILSMPDSNQTEAQFRAEMTEHLLNRQAEARAPSRDAGPVSYVTPTGQERKRVIPQYYQGLLDSAVEATALKRAEPEIRRIKQELAVQEGTLKSGVVYDEISEAAALRQSEESIGRRYRETKEELAIQQEGLNVNYIAEEDEKLTKDLETFETKYESNYDSGTETYTNLPVEGEKELVALSIRTDVYNKMVGPVAEYNKQVAVFNKKFEKYERLQELKGSVGKNKYEEYKKITKRLENPGNYDSQLAKFKDVEKQAKLAEELNELSNVYNPAVSVRARYETKNPFTEINIPFYKGDDAEQEGFLRTGFSNVMKTQAAASIAIDQTSIGKGITYGLGSIDKGFNIAADIKRDRDIKRITKLESAGIPEGLIKGEKIKSLRREKELRQIGGVFQWISRNKVGTAMLGAGLFTPIGGAIMSGAGFTTIGTKTINLLESASTRVFSTTKGVDIAFELGEEKIQTATRAGIKAEDEKFAGTKTGFISNEFLRALPGGDLGLSDPKLFTSEASKEVGLEADKDAQSYFGYRTFGTRVGSFTGVILGEAAGETLGRRYTKAFSTKVAPGLVKSGKPFKAAVETFKSTAPKIARAAPAEVIAGYSLERIGKQKEVDPGTIIAGSLIAAPTAGAIGGVIAGGHVAGQITRGGKYGVTGKVLNIGANVADIAEAPGDAFVTLSETAVGRIKKATFKKTVPVYEQFYSSYDGVSIDPNSEAFTATSKDKASAITVEPISVNEGVRDIQSQTAPIAETTIIPEKLTIKQDISTSRSAISVQSPAMIPSTVDVTTDTSLSLVTDTAVSVTTPTTTETTLRTIEPIPEASFVTTKEETNVFETVPENTAVQTPVVVTDQGFVPFVPFNLSGKGTKSGTTGFGGKKRSGYQASFDALIFGIYSDKPNVKTVYSGSETRPIIGKAPKSSGTFKILQKKINNVKGKKKPRLFFKNPINAQW